VVLGYPQDTVPKWINKRKLGEFCEAIYVKQYRDSAASILGPISILFLRQMAIPRVQPLLFKRNKHTAGMLRNQISPIPAV